MTAIGTSGRDRRKTIQRLIQAAELAVAETEGEEMDPIDLYTVIRWAHTPADIHE
jgi:hypothetical protein